MAHGPRFSVANITTCPITTGNVAALALRWSQMSIETWLFRGIEQPIDIIEKEPILVLARDRIFSYATSSG
jgi:hypothetical protein